MLGVTPSVLPGSTVPELEPSVVPDPSIVLGARVPEVNRVARVPCVVSPCLLGCSVVVSEASAPFVVAVVVSSTATVAAVVVAVAPAAVEILTQKCPSPSNPS